MVNGLRFPDIHVPLVDHDGNAFAILGSVQRALREHGVTEVEVSEFFQQATSGDYDHLLRTVMEWVEVV